MKRHRFLIVLVVLAISVLSNREVLPSEAWPTDAPSVPEKVRLLMQARSYAEAEKAIDEAAAAPNTPKDYLAYLKGRALYLQGQYDEAAAAFDAMQKDFPKSDWLRRARFAKAMALARKGDFRAAELIVSAEAENLLSADRKQQIADIYLEFANTLFKPPKDDQKPDYAKALEFYERALATGPKPETQIEVELLVAQCQQHLEKNGEAAALYEKFIKDHPQSALEIEAYFHLGECRLGEGNLKQARRVWQDLLAKHVDAQSERIAEAQFQLARTWKIPAPENDEELNLGVSALRAFIERFPKHKLASRAHLEIAESYQSRGRNEDAVVALRQFLGDKNYQFCEEIPEARELLGRCYQLQKKYAEALDTWRDYLIKHPAHKAWDSVQHEIIDTEYLMASDKLEAKQYDAANALFAEFLVKYPLDPRNPNVLMLMNRKACAEEKWDEAIAHWRQVVSKYPDSEDASHAQLWIAETLEQDLGKLEEALEEYRKVTWGSSVAVAQAAAARLTATSMTVSTPRVFRSDETPKLKLITRNIEEVTVRAYKVDLETYFRKMHLARGVEGLDIALIDPDRTFEFKVPSYAKYQHLISQLEVALPGDLHTGVMAVTISSKTLEATTLVIQSDLDVIVKSSRDEVFAFAENMRTGKPWADVRLLISNGQQVFAEGTTGKDGVFKGTFKELKDAGDVRVFAVADGSVASNVIGLQGVGVAQGLTDKGYIYTDRPAYRAGQIVHVRGCLRHAADDAYTIEKDKKYTLEIFDGRNRLLQQQAVTLGEFGSFHSYFVLPTTTVQGQYRVLVRDEAKQSYQGTFQVDEYKIEPIRLTVDTPRNVYYRGEEIEGTIRAAFYYGAPLAGREIRYQLADDRQYTATTDGKGEVHFKLPTREFSESQLLTLSVELPERNLRSGMRFVLSSQGLFIGVSTLRPVYVAGETFEAKVDTKDAEGKPTGQKLAIKVIEQTVVNGKVGERPVEEYPLETAADGVARKTLKLEKGGNYVLRVEGTDRFGNSISGQCAVQVSDDKDKIRLRILADAHNYKVGDTATVNVHWRDAPALGLVTFQGARILDYRLLELKTGANELSIPMTATLSPNFDLDVAVMTEAGSEKAIPESGPKETEERPVVRFHEASSPFEVERDLHVKFVAKRKGDAKGPVRPDDEVEVSITTTDPQGKPVAAEVSLAMIEQSLLDRFGGRVPSIEKFFQAARRESAVRTASSVTFAYTPATRPINPRLLAEEDRLEVAAAEEATRAAAVAAETPADETNGPAACESPSVTNPAFARQDTMNLRRARMGGRTAAEKSGRVDFDSLVDLIKTTVKPQSWSDTGEAGAISTFETNCSLVVNPSSEVQKQIAGLIGLAKSKVRSAALLGSDGTMQNLQLGDQKGLSAEARAAATAERIAQLRAVGLLAAAETAYWNPSIVTDKDGRATVTFTMPEQSTAWRLLAKGITADTLAGEATDSLVVKSDLFGQLKLPQSFTDGDEAEVIASVHNDAIEKGQIQVTLKTTIGARSVDESKTLDISGKGVREVPFKVKLQAAGGEARETVEFELTVAAAQQKYVVQQAIPLMPYGAPVFAAAAGSATTDTTASIEPPPEMTLEQRTLSIMIGPTVEQSLLDVLFAPSPWCQVEAHRIASGLEAATSDLMAAVGLQKLLGATRDAAGPQAQAVDARIRAGVSLLVSSQGNDGCWSWTGFGAGAERFATSRVVWALSLARRAGYNVPDATFDNAIAFVQKQLVATAENDYESKAILLHALSMTDKADFAVANRLYRERLRLSSSALAYLALALVEMDRNPTAAELLDLLDKRNLDNTASRTSEIDGSLPWSQSPVELRALCALAQQRVAPQSPKAKELADWLLAHRTGYRWSPEKATGPAALALCRWFGENRFQGERYKLTVSVNDVQAAALEIDPAAGTQTVEVPAALLKKEGKQRISFQLAGRGRYAYQCILSGFVPAEKLKNTTDRWTVKRTCEPAPLEVDGREIPRGFGVLQGNYTEFKNPLTQLPVGQRGLVDLRVRRENVPNDTPDEQLEYLVITEPIPSGATVIEDSVHGQFERFELSPGAVTFFVGHHRWASIEYELHGYLPGKYRVGPTMVRNAYRPDQLAVSTPKSLDVLQLGDKSADPYRLTPQELFELGKRSFEKGDLKPAGAHLSDLVKNWSLRPEIYKSTVKMLLDVHLELGPPAQVVHYVEIVKEKWPNDEIPFAKIVKVGAAYHEMGEFEQSYSVFRAAVEGTFVQESGVAGFLEAQGQFTRSVDVMGRLLREYPPEGYVASATYALAQHVYAKAPTAADDPQLRKEKVNRVDLLRRAWAMLESFLTAHPDDPAADQAALAAATALLDMKSYRQAADACNRYAMCYPKSGLLDTYWYIIGYCHFASGEDKPALEMCRKVAEAKRIDPDTGREEESRNKWQAIFILGQIYHSLGQAEDAIREYRRVEDKFPDAKQSIEYFLRKVIELPEVVTVKPGEPAEMELKFRNVAACDLKVYRIDLMKFSLLKRNLGGITQINLAGIRPHYETTVPLGDGKDYLDRTHKLSLPLKDEGAYLVVCRGDDLHASGLALLTPLGVEVQEDVVSGRVRTTVKDVGGKYLPEVQVKAIGTGNEDFVSGQTDLRGVFVADGIRGAATVIVQSGPARYAFYRSKGADIERFLARREDGEAGPPTNARRRVAVTAPSNQPAAASVSSEESPPSVGISLTLTAAGEKIKKALSAPAQFAFGETPLSDVVDYLKDYHGIEIQLDTKALSDAGVASDTPITKSVKGIKLRSALRLMLKDHGLTYTIRDESLVITTPEEAENHLETKIYPVADLVLLPNSTNESEADFDSLIDLLKTTVHPTSWDDTGGPGSIKEFPNNMSIVIDATEEVHEDIDLLINKLREVSRDMGKNGVPAFKRQPRSEDSGRRGNVMGGMGGGMMGGMGGMMGGMMGGGAEAPKSQAAGAVPAPRANAAPVPSQKADLLQGVRGLNQSNQGIQSQELQKIYDGGKAGVGAGKF